MKQFRFQEFLAGICLIGLLVSFIMLVGTVGAVDCNNIDISTATKKGIIWFIVLLLSVSGIVKLNNEDEEDNYDRL